MKLIPMEHGEELSKFLTQDKTFDPNDSGLFHLLFLLDEQQVKFSIIDSSTDVVLTLGHLYKNQNEESSSFLKRLIAEFDFLSREFKSVFLSYVSEKKSLVPYALFDKDNARKYLEFSGSEAETMVKTFKHSKIGAVMVSEIPKEGIMV